MRPAPTFAEMAVSLRRYHSEKRLCLRKLISAGVPLRALVGLNLRQLRDLEGAVETYRPAQAEIFGRDA